MATIEPNGRINEAGKLEVDLPDGLPTGDVKVTLAVSAANKPTYAGDGILSWALYNAHDTARAMQELLDKDEKR